MPPAAGMLVQFVDGLMVRIAAPANCDTVKLRVIPPPDTETVPVRAVAVLFTGAVSMNPPLIN